MLYVVRITGGDGATLGYLSRRKPVPLKSATVYDSPSSASHVLARSGHQGIVLPLKDAKVHESDGAPPQPAPASATC